MTTAATATGTPATGISAVDVPVTEGSRHLLNLPYYVREVKLRGGSKWGGEMY